MTSTPIPINRRLSDGHSITVNPNGTLLLTYPDGGILITAPNGDQKYVAGTKREGVSSNKGAILLSASSNEESEKAKARRLFEQEKARVQEELWNAQQRYKKKEKARRRFNAVELHDQIMDKGIIG
jgi:hypothetical protein